MTRQRSSPVQTATADPDAWQEQLRQHYFPIDARPLGDSFRGSLYGLRLGSISLFRCTSAAIAYNRSRRHVAGKPEEAYLVTTPIVSELSFNQRGREARYRPGEVYIERVHEPYSASLSRNTLLTLYVESQLLRNHICNADMYCERAFDTSQGIGAMLKDLMWSTLKRAAELSPGDAEIVERHLLDLLVLVLRNDQRALVSRSSAVRSAHLRRIDQFIWTHAHDPDLTPSSVAAACGLSVRYLHQIFAQTDFSVAEYIRRQRLIEAQSLLKTRPDLKLVEVAYRCGFSDHGAFSRQFRKEFGLSPSAYRASGDRTEAGFVRQLSDAPE